MPYAAPGFLSREFAKKSAPKYKSANPAIPIAESRAKLTENIFFISVYLFLAELSDIILDIATGIPAVATINIHVYT